MLHFNKLNYYSLPPLPRPFRPEEFRYGGGGVGEAFPGCLSCARRGGSAPRAE